MKLYKVSIDNNPGGWKSGDDPSVLVIATNKEEAFEKVRNGWGDKWSYNPDKGEGIPTTTYTQKPPDKGYSLIRSDSELSAYEIKFDGYDIHIKTPRQAKLERIEKNMKRNEITEYLLNLTQPILRKLMSKDEIKVANELVKNGKLKKGISDDKQKSVIFYNYKI